VKTPSAKSVFIDFVDRKSLGAVPCGSNWMKKYMNNPIWLVGVVVIILFILGYFGLR